MRVFPQLLDRLLTSGLWVCAGTRTRCGCCRSGRADGRDRQGGDGAGSAGGGVARQDRGCRLDRRKHQFRAGAAGESPEALGEPVSWEQKRRVIEVLVSGIRVETVEEDGVKQAKITVTYRFSQPDQPVPLALPQSYSTGRVVRIPTQLKTVGDHIRKRRLGLKMLQRELGDLLGVCEPSVFNWERNSSSPEIRYMPAIIDFLGYDPLPEANGWGERLVRHRTTLGITQKAAADRLGVDQGTLARWEQGKREPAGGFLARVKRFLSG